ncbi:MAG: hypothetical protein V4539_20995 [Bacteroidota bacterium]
MNIYADKTQKNKSQSVANGIIQKRGDSESTIQFIDNRPEAVAQRKLQELANSRSQVYQLQRDDEGVSFIKNSGFLRGTDGLFASHKPPEASRSGVNWQDNRGPHSRKNIPSTRPGGMPVDKVPPMKNMPKKPVGAYGGKSVHAFAMRNGTLDVHHKDEQDVHTKLSPRTIAELEAKNPTVFAGIKAAAAQEAAKEQQALFKKLELSEEVARARLEEQSELPKTFGQPKDPLEGFNHDDPQLQLTTDEQTQLNLFRLYQARTRKASNKP